MVKKISKKNNYNSERGIALVEVIAAMGVAIMVITALVSLSISTLRTSLNSKLLLEGSEVANREIERVRAYRDNNSWADFIEAVRGCTADTPCSMNSDISVTSSSTTEGTGSEVLTRSFTATKVDETALSTDPLDQIVRISVSVTWKIGDQDKEAHIYTDLTNWREE